MPSSLLFNPEVKPMDLAGTLGHLLGASVTDLEAIGNGRNSQVYRVRCSDQRLYAAKRYPRHPSDARDRLATEFDSLQFLWDAGIRTIPQPVVEDRRAGMAVYAFIDGARIHSEHVTPHDVDAAVEFLAALRALRDHPESHRLPAASEACFTLGAIGDTIEARLGRLAATDAEGPLRGALEDFLHQEFRPAFHRVRLP
ncbi:MAG: hypothetical protein HYW10_04905 [Candidatus Omnitrophica bacterium]|nr:hypothetical protein [Candidatus Omnitrophota bacterium]